MHSVSRRYILVALCLFALGAGTGAVLALGAGGDDAPAPRTDDGGDAPAAEVAAEDAATATPTSTAAAARPAPLLGRGAAASFARLGLGEAAAVAVAPVGAGAVEAVGGRRSGHAWSTMKVPLLVAVIRDTGSYGGLSARQRADARAALTRSDNAAALALFADLERSHGGLAGASEAIEQVLRDAGDERTRVNTERPAGGFSTFGQTLWSAGASVAFHRALARGCLLDPPSTRAVLGLMRAVVADQRWGVGQAGYPASTRLALKGGWGPESGGGYLVRQSAIVGTGARAHVVSLIARSADFAAGQRAITQLAQWVRRRARPRASTAEGCG